MGKYAHNGSLPALPAAAPTHPAVFLFSRCECEPVCSLPPPPPPSPLDAHSLCEFTLPPSPSPSPLSLERRCPSSSRELCFLSRASMRLRLLSSVLVPTPHPSHLDGPLMKRRALSPSPPPSCSLVRTPAPLTRTRAILPLSRVQVSEAEIQSQHQSSPHSHGGDGMRAAGEVFTSFVFPSLQFFWPHAGDPDGDASCVS